MSEPIRTLKLADSLFPALRLGKGNTIRTGHRNIALGPLAFESVSGALPPETVDVTSVRHAVVRDLTDREIASNGARDLDHWLAENRMHYPDIDRDTKVTVVSW